MTNPFRHHDRKRLTAQDRAAIFASTDGHCTGPCRRKLRPGDAWDADHILALELGGQDAPENMQPLCEGCHTLKTAEDHAQAGHNRRAYTRHNVPGEFRRSRSWGRR